MSQGYRAFSKVSQDSSLISLDVPILKTEPVGLRTERDLFSIKSILVSHEMAEEGIPEGSHW